MPLSTYTELNTAIANWLDRTDLTNEIIDFITLAETKIYRKIRVRDMETALNVITSSGIAATPSDYIELKFAYVDGTPTQSLERTTIDTLYSLYPTRSSIAKPKFIADNVDNFEFGPFPDTDYTIKGTYYAKPAALSGSNETNFLITDNPDLILFGALIESSSFTGDTERLTEWAAKYETAENDINQQAKRQRISGGALRSIAR